MAEAAADGSDDEHQRLLECSICMNYLLDQRMLPCQHTFCGGCLEPLVHQNNIICPVCRDVCTLRGKKVSQLPRNLVLGELQDKHCESCHLNKKSVVCLHCNKNVCDICIEKHASLLKNEATDLLDRSYELLPQMLTAIENVHTSIADIHNQTDVALQAIEDSASKIIDTIGKRKMHLKEKLRHIKKTQLHKQKEILDKLSSNTKTVTEFQSKIRCLTISQDNLGDIQSICNNIKGNLRSAHEITSTSFNTAIEFKANEETILDINSTYGEVSIHEDINAIQINIKQYKSNDYHSKGVPQKVFGDEGDKSGCLSSPSYITVSKATGNIIVCDSGNSRINIYTKNGDFVNQFGKEGQKNNEFKFDDTYYDTGGVAVNDRGTIIIADTDNDRLQLVTEGGAFIRTIGIDGSAPGEFKSPKGVTVDQTGRIYVCDSDNKRIQILKPDGSVDQIFVAKDRDKIVSPSDIALLSNGDIIVSCCNPGAVLIYTEQGQHKATLGTGDQASVQLKKPMGVTVDNDDNILVTDSKTDKVHVLRPNGELVHSFGKGGNRPGQLDRPVGVACTVDGQIVVADCFNHRIQIF